MDAKPHLQQRRMLQSLLDQEVLRSKGQTTRPDNEGLVELHGRTLYVTPDEIEDSGYAVVSQRYLERLEFVAAHLFSFLEGDFDEDILREEITR